MKKFIFGLFFGIVLLCTSCGNAYYLVTGDAVYRVDGAANVREVKLSVRVLRKIFDKFKTDSLPIISAVLLQSYSVDSLQASSEQIVVDSIGND